jgi:hypothetical protein
VLAIDALESCLPPHLGAWVAAALVVAAGCCGVLAWVQNRRHRAQACAEVLRAAADVARIAGALERELARTRGEPRWEPYRLRCARLRARADLALANTGRVRHLSMRRLVRALSRLRSDLRKLKHCHTELQAAVFSWNCARAALAQQVVVRDGVQKFPLRPALAGS